MVKQTVVNEYYCDKCGKKIDGQPEIAGFKREIQLCYECYCDFYSTCSVCGTTLSDDDIFYDLGNDAYCEKCVDNLQSLYQHEINAIKEFKNRHKS